jgi:hypothetical protein
LLALELLNVAIAIPGSAAALVQLWGQRALVTGQRPRARTELDLSLHISIRRG